MWHAHHQAYASVPPPPGVRDLAFADSLFVSLWHYHHQAYASVTAPTDVPVVPFAGPDHSFASDVSPDAPVHSAHAHETVSVSADQVWYHHHQAYASVPPPADVLV